MRRAFLVLLTSALAACSTPWGPGGGKAVVTFVNPGRFTDAQLYGVDPVTDKSPALVDLRRRIERLGQRLPAGQVLQVEVTDVDLAGIRDPFNPTNPNFRAFVPATWPRINLRYVLLAPDGSVLRRGEEEVTDQSYLMQAGTARSNDPLRYEDNMLRDWFTRRFGPNAS